MKDLKTIFGIILICASLYAMGEYIDILKGAELAGAITAFIILVSLGGWMTYTGALPKTYLSKETITERKLSKLKDSGLLTEEEYQNKILHIKKSTIEENIEHYPEYQQLNELYKNGILTKKEFADKKEILIKRKL